VHVFPTINSELYNKRKKKINNDKKKRKSFEIIYIYVRKERRKKIIKLPIMMHSLLDHTIYIHVQVLTNLFPAPNVV
jgi:hypothetical protein